MDYEKKYNDALKRAKAVMDVAANQDEARGIATTIFPELRESEDERIRKKCIELIKRVIPSGDSQSQESKEILDCIAYLEKQKEEEGYEAIPVESTLEYKLGFKAGKESEKQKEQKPAEWREEDERLLTKLMTFVDIECFDRECNGQDLIDWLKSLRPKSKEELAKMLQDEYNKGREEGERIGHTKGYNEAYKDAEEAYNKTVSYHP